ncbi:MAG TPA: HAD family hydrolase [Polyangiales bacterium]|nr:HAD family hydrolase [Polyangiales bacterium]
MRKLSGVDCFALACDYDETLADEGRVPSATYAALQRLRASGRKLILVTGRELPELRMVCTELGLFDRVVAENGALLFTPATGQERVLTEPPPAALVAALSAAHVEPLSIGRVIVATREPMQAIVLEAIRTLGLEHQVIFNKGAVMVLPPGVNKASGLRVALDELALSARDVVAVGDAENDHALLSACGFGVAVANAVPMLKQHAQWVTNAPRGAGVVELIARILANELARLTPSRADGGSPRP